MLKLLHFEENDYNIAAAAGAVVLTFTPTAYPRTGILLLAIGDGVNNLSGVGGNFELRIKLNNGVSDFVSQPSPQVIEFGPNAEAFVWSSMLPLLTWEISVELKSPNAADTLVHVRAYLYDASFEDIRAINGNEDGPARFDRATRAITTGTVGAGSTTTSIVTSSLSPAAIATDQFKGQIVCFDKDTTTAGLRGQKTDIVASTTGGVLTVTALSTAPVSGDTFTIQ